MRVMQPELQSSSSAQEALAKLRTGGSLNGGPPHRNGSSLQGRGYSTASTASAVSGRDSLSSRASRRSSIAGRARKMSADANFSLARHRAKVAALPAKCKAAAAGDARSCLSGGGRWPWTVGLECLRALGARLLGPRGHRVHPDRGGKQKRSSLLPHLPGRRWVPGRHPKTTGQQLDQLRRLSMQRMSLSSSSLMGAWYKDDDVSSQPTGHWYILHPISTFRVLWDYALRALVVGTLLVVPLRLAFVHADSHHADVDLSEPRPPMAVLGDGTVHSAVLGADLALDALAVLDVVSNFFFGFVTVNTASAKKEVVADWWRIASRYMRHSCALELLSIGIPFQALAYRTLWVQWLSLLKLLRVQRLIRVRARERHRAHEAGRMPPNVVVEKTMDIARLLAAFLVWGHVCGCMYCFIGRIQTPHPSGANMPWIVRLGNEEPDIGEHDHGSLYIYSLYWAMATALTIGYGELTPHTNHEKVFATIMMLFSSVLYATIFGQVTTLVDSLDQINRRYQSELQRFTEFASIYKLPFPLRGRMYAHVHYNWQVSRGVSMETVLDALPTGVRRDIQMFLLSSIVANFPIFANTPPNFITAVVEKFRAELLVPNEFVFQADEPGKHLYIIHIGRVEVITPEGVVVGKLSDGAYFGEIAILVDVRRTSSVRTVCRCHFYKLSKEDFDEVLEDFPELRDRMVAKAMVRLQKTMRVRSKAGIVDPQQLEAVAGSVCGTPNSSNPGASPNAKHDQPKAGMSPPPNRICEGMGVCAGVVEASVHTIPSGGPPKSCQQWERRLSQQLGPEEMNGLSANPERMAEMRLSVIAKTDEKEDDEDDENRRRRRSIDRGMAAADALAAAHSHAMAAASAAAASRRSDGLEDMCTHDSQDSVVSSEVDDGSRTAAARAARATTVDEALRAEAR